MSASGSEEPFATKTIDLKARLQQMQAQHASRAQEIENEAFRRFESDLTALLNVDAATFRSEFDSLLAALNGQRERLRGEIAAETKRLMWMIRLPTAICATACLLMVAFCLLWFRNERIERVRMSPWRQNGVDFRLVDDPTWELCETRRIEQRTPKAVTTILMQPCKRVD